MAHTNDTWQVYQIYCPNCRNKVLGQKNAQGMIKACCNHCHSVLVRIDRSRRHSTIEIYAPESTHDYPESELEVI